jgi:hypothetical protein
MKPILPAGALLAWLFVGFIALLGSHRTSK